MNLVSRLINNTKKSRIWDFLLKYALQIILVGFTVFGLVCKLIISLNRDLDSDTVNPGIMSMEMWKHSNYLLQDFYVPSNCSHLFTEVLTLYFIPNILSNFSPVVYRCVPFVLFALIIIVFSYIIYLMTGSLVKSLVFSALVANLAPASYFYYSQPVNHNGVIFFIGLLSLLLFSQRISYYVKLVIFTVIVALLVLSDTMIIVWFIIPLVIYYVLFYRQKDLRKNLSLILVCGIGVVALVVKTLLVDYYVVVSTHLEPLSTIVNVNIPLYLNGLLLLYNGSLYQSINGFSSLDVLDVLFAVITLLLAYLVYRDHPRKIEGKLLMVYSIMFIAAVVMMIAYIGTDYAQGITTTRYLIFTGILIFVLIAVSFNEKSKLYVYTIIALLALLAISNISYLNTLDNQPNKEQYGLISFLQANDLHYGYGNYWTANVITYLSNENVSIRQMNFNDSIKLNDTSQIIPFRWFSNESWYTYKPDAYFIIIDKGQSIQTDFISGYVKTHDVYSKLEEDNYEIYVFHSKPDVLMSTQKSNISKFLHAIGIN
jgi:hypothetical protein